MNNEVNTMSAFEIEALTFDLMNKFEEHKVVFNGEETLCVGGVEYSGYGHFALYQDFFNRREIPLFTNSEGDFVAENITHSKFQEGKIFGIRIEVHRTDGILYIYCTSPNLMIDDIEVETIWDLCNETIIDNKESRTIDGIEYNVTNPAKITLYTIPKDVYDNIREILDADDFKDITLKFYFVRCYHKRKFYVGLWDASKHCPVNFDIKGKGNSDYSRVYELLF